MNISIVLSDNTCIKPGQRIPISAIQTVKELISLDKISYHWFPGSSNDEIEGQNVLVVGKEYIIGHRHYDLSSGYGLSVKLSPKSTLIPRLRKAVGKEIEIFRDKNGLPINQYWPIIEQA